MKPVGSIHAVSSGDAAVDSFHRLPNGLPPEARCQGTACFVARHRDPARWASTGSAAVHCLGQCFSGPAAAGDGRRPQVTVDSRESVVLDRVAHGGARTLDRYLDRGGYTALTGALTLGRGGVLRAVDDSELRGRGGAGFPTGTKWRALAQGIRSAGDGFVVANADEGDPGAFMDRFLMEDDPFALIEGMTLAAFATGARRGWIYLRAEYPAAGRALRSALGEARDSGRLGPRILGGDFDFEIGIVAGRGSYICGEETALIRSLEGRRPEVQSRPPLPTEHGFRGQPTLVNNVETLVNIPWIVRHGAEAFKSLGFSRSRGTKAVSLNSLFRRPGLYEVEFGVTVRHLVEELGGGLRDGAAIQGLLIGGPLAGILGPRHFDTPFGFEELQAVGACVGHGGIVAFDSRTSLAELAHQISRFAADESCGKCTPCRLGSRRLEELFARACPPGALNLGEEREVQRLTQALQWSSLCGHGRGLGDLCASAARLQRGEDVPCRS